MYRADTSGAASTAAAADDHRREEQPSHAGQSVVSTSIPTGPAVMFTSPVKMATTVNTKEPHRQEELRESRGRRGRVPPIR